MAEIPICMHCQKVIDKDKEEYVVFNKPVRVGAGGDIWFYAHSGCQRKKDEQNMKGG